MARLKRPLRSLRALHFDTLEARDLLTTFDVNTLLDLLDTTPVGDGIVDVDPDTSGNQISLRAAIEEANTLPGDDTINLPAGDYRLQRYQPRLDAFGQLIVADPKGFTSVVGADSSLTTIRYDESQELTDRLFAVESLGTLHLSGVRLTGGAVGGETGYGGAIFNAGDLVTLNVIFENNRASTGGGALANVGGTASLERVVIRDNFADEGGAIVNLQGHVSLLDSTVDSNVGSWVGGLLNFDSLTLSRSTVSRNQSTAAERFQASQAGGIANAGTLLISTSTVSGNLAVEGAGAIWSSDDSTTTLAQSTVTNNSVQVASDQSAGGLVLDSGGRLSLYYTLVTGNYFGAAASATASDVSGNVDDTSSYNLIGSDLELTGISHGFQGNIIGTANAPLNARLDILQDNGGPTWTHGLQTGSPAIDAGQLGDAQGVDQTGLERPQDGDGDGVAQPDIGAVEHAQVIVPRLSRIAGFAYEDQRGDGTFQESEDSFLAAVTVTLVSDADSDGVVETRQQLSDPINGGFSFNDLPPGDYQLTVAANGLTSVNSTPILVTVDEGQQIVANNGLIDPAHEATQLIVDTRLALGWVRASEVSGTVWQDISGDGISPDDTGRGEILVRVRRDDGDEVFDSNDEFTAESLTHSDGTFRITIPFPGSYWVQATLPDGYVVTPLNETSAVQFVTLSSGQVAADNDFAIAQLPRIRGQVRDNETLVGLAGRRIRLVSPSGETLNEVITNIDGHYEFTIQVPGEYEVQEDVPVGWEPIPRFANAIPIQAGLFLESIRSADFDGDGDHDLIVVNDTSSTLDQSSSLMVFQNDGVGNFSLSQELKLPSGTRPSESLIADMNGDGRLDIVIASLDRVGDLVDSSGVIVLESDLGHRFAVSTSLSSVRNPQHLAVADLNGDGLTDIVTAHPAEQIVSIWLGQANHAYVALPVLQLELSPTFVDVADLDADERPDLMLLDYGSNRAQFWVNQGNGKFVIAASLPTAAGPTDVVFADWNQDGRLDLGVVNRLDDSIGLYENEGSFDFGQVGLLEGFHHPQEIRMGDLNGDLTDDFVVVNAGGASVSVFYHADDFEFGKRFDTSTQVGDHRPQSPQTIDIADMDGNGTSDLVVGNYASGGAVLLNHLPQYSLDVQFNSDYDNVDFRDTPAFTWVTRTPIAEVSAAPGELAESPFAVPGTVDDSLDVNGDGLVTALDALLVINELNSPAPILAATAALASRRRLDANGDGQVTPIDALLVINRLNATSAGELSVEAELPANSSPEIAAALSGRELVAVLDTALVEAIPQHAQLAVEHLVAAVAQRRGVANR